MDSEKTNSSIRSSCSRLKAYSVLVGLIAVTVPMIFYLSEEFDPAPYPSIGTRDILSIPAANNRVLNVLEKIGEGLLLGPEDMAYDEGEGVIYTGTEDGWIKKVFVDREKTPVVENWVYVGGRPLGIALSPEKHVIVADAYQGLLKVTKEGDVSVLAEEANDVKFKLTDGVDVASDGIIYFTDASDKYNLTKYPVDILEGRPHGRFISYNPTTRQCTVLVDGIYFANGVAVSPENDFVVFCETSLSRCRRYYISGEKKGTLDEFIDNLPGFPDNIRYDKEGHFWIGIPSSRTKILDVLWKYTTIRKILYMLNGHVYMGRVMRYGGLLCVSNQGTPIAFYSDPGLSQVTSGLKISKYLYFGSLYSPYLRRLNLDLYKAEAY